MQSILRIKQRRSIFTAQPNLNRQKKISGGGQDASSLLNAQNALHDGLVIPVASHSPLPRALLPRQAFVDNDGGAVAVGGSQEGLLCTRLGIAGGVEARQRGL